jgi:hypothetical protein
MREADDEPLVEESYLVHAHRGRSTPVCPISFVLLIVILRVQVNRGVNEAEHKTLCSPVNDEIDDHVVLINGDFGGVCPRRRRTLVAKLTSDPRETRKANPVSRRIKEWARKRSVGASDSPSHATMQRPALYHTTHVLLCSGLFVWVHERQEGFAYEKLCLLLKVTLKDWIHIDEVQLGRQKHPILKERKKIGSVPLQSKDEEVRNKEGRNKEKRLCRNSGPRTTAVIDV